MQAGDRTVGFVMEERNVLSCAAHPRRTLDAIEWDAAPVPFRGQLLIGSRTDGSDAGGSRKNARIRVKCNAACSGIATPRYDRAIVRRCVSVLHITLSTCAQPTRRFATKKYSFISSSSFHPGNPNEAARARFVHFGPIHFRLRRESTSFRDAVHRRTSSIRVPGNESDYVLQDPNFAAPSAIRDMISSSGAKELISETITHGMFEAATEAATRWLRARA